MTNLVSSIGFFLNIGIIERLNNTIAIKSATKIVTRPMIARVLINSAEICVDVKTAIYMHIKETYINESWIIANILFDFISLLIIDITNKKAKSIFDEFIFNIYVDEYIWYHIIRKEI